MCGRYAAAENPDELKMFLELPDQTIEALPPNYNVAPTHPVYVMDELSGERALRIVSWGLIPAWAKDAKRPWPNARADTLAEKPSFRNAFAKTRCLVPATGWFEWESVNETKQPFFFQRADHNPVVMAGLLEAWKNPESGQWLRTMTLVTTDAASDLAYIHDRMPVVLERDEWSAWLNPQTPTGVLHELMNPTTAGVIEAYPISTRVNSVRNNDSELLAHLGNK